MRLVVKHNKAPKEGLLYILQFNIDGRLVVKIGITTRSDISERVCEILTAMFKCYRRFWYCYPKRFRKVTDPYDKEQVLLKWFADRKADLGVKFAGSSEFVDVPLEEVVAAYEWLLDKGVMDGFSYKLPMEGSVEGEAGTGLEAE